MQPTWSLPPASSANPVVATWDVIAATLCIIYYRLLRTARRVGHSTLVFVASSQDTYPISTFLASVATYIVARCTVPVELHPLVDYSFLAYLACYVLVTIFLVFQPRQGLADMPRDATRDQMSEWLNERVITYHLATKTMAAAFRDAVMPERKVQEIHSHPQAAAARNTASAFIDHLATELGLHALYYQMSSADVRRGRDGTRSWFWGKDVDVRPIPYVPNLNDVEPNAPRLLTLIDTDYYVDMNALLANHNGPVALYTFIPETTACAVGEEVYTFNDRSELTMRVSGGAEYKHRLWNWSVEHVFVQDMDCRIPYYDPVLKRMVEKPIGDAEQVQRAALYRVERRRIAPNRYLVLLCPIARWETTRRWWHVTTLTTAPELAGACFGAERLHRLDVHDSGFLRLTVSTKQGASRVTSRVNEYTYARVSITTDDAIAAQARVCAQTLAVSQVQTIVEKTGDTDESLVTALILCEYHRLKRGVVPSTVCPVDEGIVRYQYAINLDDNAKPSMVAFMPPIIDACYAPDVCAANDDAAVERRVLAVKPPIIPLTQFMINVQAEFLALLIPEPHTLVPVDLEEVTARQPRAGQRQIIERARDNAARNGPKAHRMKNFVKKETYEEAKDPRMITTLDGDDKVDYSTYMYAFQQIMKRHPWYAFGCTPAQIARRVGVVCAQAREHVGNTDLSRFDGRYSNILRELEVGCMVRAFRHDYHDTLLELHRSGYNQTAVTTFGRKYNTGYARASGSPETSLFNTIANAFIQFLALRMTKENGDFLNAEQSWSRLGVYGGDDGVTADLARDIATKAATMVGQKLTYEPITRNSFGVKFLSRIYDSTVWHGGDPSCICDVRRQLVKLHVTVRLPPDVTPEQKLVEKCRALILSDAHTPLIGLLASRVLELGGGLSAAEHSRELHSWAASEQGALRPVSEQYDSTGTEWQKYVDDKLPRFDVARFTSHVKTAATLSALLAFPLCESVEKQTTATVPVLINGERTTLAAPDKSPPPPILAGPPHTNARPSNYKGKKPKDMSQQAARANPRAGVAPAIAAAARP